MSFRYGSLFNVTGAANFDSYTNERSREHKLEHYHETFRISRYYYNLFNTLVNANTNK